MQKLFQMIFTSKYCEESRLKSNEINRMKKLREISQILVQVIRPNHRIFVCGQVHMNMKWNKIFLPEHHQPHSPIRSISHALFQAAILKHMIVKNRTGG